MMSGAGSGLIGHAGPGAIIEALAAAATSAPPRIIFPSAGLLKPHAMHASRRGRIAA